MRWITELVCVKIHRLSFQMLILSVLISVSHPVEAEDCVLFITSNLEGRFQVGQPLDRTTGDALRTFQCLDAERAGKYPVMYLDLGNAFYPGVLSRFSFGAVMYDYFKAASCDAALISSKDMRLGSDILSHLDFGDKKILLSANIRNRDDCIFNPYITRTIGTKKIALIGLSNESTVFDITDKITAKIRINPYLDTVSELINSLKQREKPDYIIVLSSLRTEKNVEIINAFPEVSLIISGGDSTGNVYSRTASQIIYPDGRRILMTDARKGYFKALCSLQDRIAVRDFTYSESRDTGKQSARLRDFKASLDLWKETYNQQQGFPAQREPYAGPAAVDTRILANMLRDKYGTELSILPADAMKPFTVTSATSASNIAAQFSDDYNLYTYKITGSELSDISSDPAYFTSGVSDGKVQGYPIDSSKNYSVVSSQKCFERIRPGDSEHGFTNRWITMPEFLVDDIRSDRKYLTKDFSYLDSRFAFMFHMTLSNKVNGEAIKSGSQVTTPAGQNSRSNRQWGFEDSADFIAYNRYHKITLSPYIDYLEQDMGKDRTYLSNQMKGTLLYQLNIHPVYQPYFNSEIDSAIKRVDGAKPLENRETAGLLINMDYLTSKFGAGFDKMLRDPNQAATYGLEFTADGTFPIWNGFSYILDLNLFGSRDISSYYLKTSVTNGLSYSFNSYLSMTSKYKFFHYWDGKTRQTFMNNSFTVSVDLTTDFKVF